MRNLKKVLALVVAFSMMLSVVAFAGYKDVAADADYADAVELLSALEIFQGDENGNFNPDNTVTRAEMTAIVCRAMGLEAQAKKSAGKTDFSDVGADHWAAGYVNLAAQKGIINGFPDGTFKPSDTLTYEQAIKMLVCAIDFERVAEDEGGYEKGGYSKVADETAKITDGAAANATRGNLAIIVNNAIHAPMLDQTTYGDNKNFQILNGESGKAFKSLLTERKIYIASGVVGAKDEDVVAFTVEEDSDDLKFKAKQPLNIKIGASDIASYKNSYVDVYVEEYAKGKYEALAVIPSAVGETLTILSDDIAKVTAGDKTKDSVVEYYVDAANSSKTKKIEVATNATFEYNTTTTNTTFDSIDDIKKVTDVEIVFIENDGDGIYDVVVGTKYDSYRIQTVEADRDRLGYGDRTVKFDFEDEAVTYVIEDAAGNALTLADFAKDDVIAVVTDGSNGTRYENYIKIVKLTDAAVTGTISETWATTTDDGVINYVSIDGADYVDGIGTLASGDEGTFYIGMTGKIIDFEGTAKAGNYGYILEAGETKTAFSNTWQVKILTAKDGVVTYDVDEDIIEATKGDDLAAKNLLLALDEKDAGFQITWDAAAKDEGDKRLVEFDTNSKGLIDELYLADGTLSAEITDDYRANSQNFGGKLLASDATVLFVGKAKADDNYKADISYLVDEGNYTGYVFKDAKNRENCLVLVTKGVGALKAEGGFAIATKVSTGENEDGEYTKVSYVKGEEEGEVTITKDSEVVVKGTIAVGNVFLFNANAEGVVTEYAVIAEYDADKGFKVIADAEFKANTFGKDTAIGAGFLYKKLDGSGSYKTIYVAEDGAKTATALEIPGAAYKYTYAKAGKTTKIEIGDYMAVDTVDFYAEQDDKTVATPVLYVVIEDVVSDIYTGGAKQVKADLSGVVIAE